MKTYIAATDYPENEFSTFFWGALIFLAVVVSCFFLWKAVEWLRSRMAFHGRATTSRAETTKDYWEQAISRPAADHNYASLMGAGSEMGGFEGMTQREQEILFSTYGPRKIRKEMKQRRRAREQKARERDR